MAICQKYALLPLRNMALRGALNAQVRRPAYSEGVFCGARSVAHLVHVMPLGTSGAEAALLPPLPKASEVAAPHGAWPTAYGLLRGRVPP